MVIQFYLKFTSKPGQSLFVTGNVSALGNNDITKAIPLSYLNQNLWLGNIEFENDSNEIAYQYVLREADGTYQFDADKNKTLIADTLSIIALDTWQAHSNAGNVFFTKPFTKIFAQSPRRLTGFKEPKVISHQFKIKAPLLHPDECICISGSGKIFKDWDVKKLIPLKQIGNWHTVKINLSAEHFPLDYKYGIYNIKKKSFTYEEGANRQLEKLPVDKALIVLHDGFIHCEKQWRGAGVAIPVFSLRTEDGFGVGEFLDIKLLADWAKATGIKMLQLLPVNDTTATHTNKDSYPYAAISAFALHPLYINLEKVADVRNIKIVKALYKKKKQLNALPDVDYEQVMKFKVSALRELYALQKDILNTIDYKAFFKLNKDWLMPYAAFCYLRDKNSTADFNQWRYNKKYDATAIRRLSAPAQNEFDEIAFQYFVQYHLHLQLKEAKEYATKKGIALKGDIPIGVSPNSCDVWVDPVLFNTNEQSGAPPDDFAVRGQNWGFPTYNWERMAEDGFAWWNKRLHKMEEYFDAFRIDHILGFFRIWSISAQAVEGVLGRFVPAVPLQLNELEKKQIWFDHERYCQPYITNGVIEKEFGGASSFVKDNFLEEKANGCYLLKPAFNTQQKVENYFKYEADAESFKNGLFNLISNVIFIEEVADQFHFRIDMQKTSSFKDLDLNTQSQLHELYINYFYHRQETLWKAEAMKKLPFLKNNTNMLVCGEDLGMVPQSVEAVMQNLQLLSLEVQRMPKKQNIEFSHPKDAPYLSVVTPSTHDMSTLRLWWKEDKEKTQRFYNNGMGNYGKAPDECEPWICRDILMQHLYSPAMLSIFQLQDIFGTSEKLRRENAEEERINVPADVEHFWRYRIHLTLDELIRNKEFSKEIKKYITESGRG